MSPKRTAMAVPQMDARVPVVEYMHTHPNCRCVMVPVTKSWTELGYPEVDAAIAAGDLPAGAPPTQSGEDMLKSLPIAEQQRRMGLARWNTWNGARGRPGVPDGVGLPLDRLYRDVYHPDWGWQLRLDNFEQLLDQLKREYGASMAEAVRDARYPPKPPPMARRFEHASPLYVGPLNEETVHEVEQSWRAKLGAEAGDAIGEDAFAPDSPEVQQDIDALNAALRSVLDPAKTEVRTRVPEEALLGILSDGRFKSQHETDTSGGFLSPGRRERVEDRAFGPIPDETQKPIYGYITTRDEDSPGVRPYGDVVVRLRETVNNRTTFTLDDSLVPIDEGSAAPTPYVDPFVTAIPGYLTTSQLLNMQGKTTEGALKVIRPKPFYFEAQVHGQVTIDDIAEVIFTVPADIYEDDPDGDHDEEGIARRAQQTALLDAMGIPWREERDWDLQMDATGTVPMPAAPVAPTPAPLPITPPSPVRAYRTPVKPRPAAPTPVYAERMEGPLAPVATPTILNDAAIIASISANEGVSKDFIRHVIDLWNLGRQRFTADQMRSFYRDLMPTEQAVLDQYLRAKGLTLLPEVDDIGIAAPPQDYVPAAPDLRHQRPLDAGRAAIWDTAVVARQKVAAMLGVYPSSSRWTGDVLVESDAYPRSGYFSWDGTLAIREATSARIGARVATSVHEILHSFSPSTPHAYTGWPGWEEGVAEGATRVLLREVAEAMEYDGDAVVEARGTDGYREYVEPLERIRGTLGMTAEAFYAELLKTPLGDRSSKVMTWLAEQAATLTPQDWQNVFVATRQLDMANPTYLIAGHVERHEDRLARAAETATVMEELRDVLDMDAQTFYSRLIPYRRDGTPSLEQAITDLWHQASALIEAKRRRQRTYILDDDLPISNRVDAAERERDLGALADRLGARLAGISAGVMVGEGGGGYLLSPEVTIEEVARQTYEKAKVAEPAITLDIALIGEDLGIDPDFEGMLTHRLKSESSLIRKIGNDVRTAAQPTTYAEAAANLKDTVRYTYITTEDQYESAYIDARAALEAKGYTHLRTKNFWTEEGVDAQYQGLNSVFISPDGQAFELQFHTEASLRAKNLNHDLKELWEHPDTSEEARARLIKEMEGHQREVPKPPGVFALNAMSGVESVDRTTAMAPPPAMLGVDMTDDVRSAASLWAGTDAYGSGRNVEMRAALSEGSGRYLGEARVLAAAVASGTTAPALYRGIAINVAADGIEHFDDGGYRATTAGMQAARDRAMAYAALRPGDTITMNLSSWTTSRDYAVDFSAGGLSPIVFELAAGSRGLDLTAWGIERGLDEGEWMTDGVFRVVSARVESAEYGDPLAGTDVRGIPLASTPRVVVQIEQVRPFAPDERMADGMAPSPAGTFGPLNDLPNVDRVNRSAAMRAAETPVDDSVGMQGPLDDSEPLVLSSRGEVVDFPVDGQQDFGFEVDGPTPVVVSTVQFIRAWERLRDINSVFRPGDESLDAGVVAGPGWRLYVNAGQSVALLDVEANTIYVNPNTMLAWGEQDADAAREMLERTPRQGVVKRMGGTQFNIEVESRIPLLDSHPDHGWITGLANEEGDAISVAYRRNMVAAVYDHTSSTYYLDTGFFDAMDDDEVRGLFAGESEPFDLRDEVLDSDEMEEELDEPSAYDAVHRRIAWSSADLPGGFTTRPLDYPNAGLMVVRGTDVWALYREDAGSLPIATWERAENAISTAGGQIDFETARAAFSDVGGSIPSVTSAAAKWVVVDDVPDDVPGVDPAQDPSAYAPETGRLNNPGAVTFPEAGPQDWSTWSPRDFDGFIAGWRVPRTNTSDTVVRYRLVDPVLGDANIYVKYNRSGVAVMAAFVRDADGAVSVVSRDSGDVNTSAQAMAGYIAAFSAQEAPVVAESTEPAVVTTNWREDDRIEPQEPPASMGVNFALYDEDLLQRALPNMVERTAAPLSVVRYREGSSTAWATYDDQGQAGQTFVLYGDGSATIFATNGVYQDVSRNFWGGVIRLPVSHPAPDVSTQSVTQSSAGWVRIPGSEVSDWVAQTQDAWGRILTRATEADRVLTVPFLPDGWRVLVHGDPTNRDSGVLLVLIDPRGDLKAAVNISDGTKATRTAEAVAESNADLNALGAMVGRVFGAPAGFTLPNRFEMVGHDEWRAVHLTDAVNDAIQSITDDVADTTVKLDVSDFGYTDDLYAYFNDESRLVGLAYADGLVAVDYDFVDDGGIVMRRMAMDIARLVQQEVNQQATPTVLDVPDSALVTPLAEETWSRDPVIQYAITSSGVRAATEAGAYAGLSEDTDPRPVYAIRSPDGQIVGVYFPFWTQLYTNPFFVPTPRTEDEWRVWARMPIRDTPTQPAPVYTSIETVGSAELQRRATALLIPTTVSTSAMTPVFVARGLTTAVGTQADAVYQNGVLIAFTFVRDSGNQGIVMYENAGEMTVREALGLPPGVSTPPPQPASNNSTATVQRWSVDDYRNGPLAPYRSNLPDMADRPRSQWQLYASATPGTPNARVFFDSSGYAQAIQIVDTGVIHTYADTGMNDARVREWFHRPAGTTVVSPSTYTAPSTSPSNSAVRRPTAFVPTGDGYFALPRDDDFDYTVRHTVAQSMVDEGLVDQLEDVLDGPPNSFAFIGPWDGDTEAAFFYYGPNGGVVAQAWVSVAPGGDVTAANPDGFRVTSVHWVKTHTSFRRLGLSTRLYEWATINGFRIEVDSGLHGLTDVGAKYWRARRGRPFSRIVMASSRWLASKMGEPTSFAEVLRARKRKVVKDAATALPKDLEDAGVPLMPEDAPKTYQLGKGAYGEAVPAAEDPAERGLPVVTRPLFTSEDTIGRFENGAEPSQTIEFDPTLASLDDIDFAAAYTVRKHKQDATIVTLVGDIVRRLELPINGESLRLEGLPLDRMDEVYDDLGHFAPNATLHDQTGVIEMSVYDSMKDDDVLEGFRQMAAKYGARMRVLPAHIRWYWHDESTYKAARQEEGGEDGWFAGPEDASFIAGDVRRRLVASGDARADRIVARRRTPRRPDPTRAGSEGVRGGDAGAASDADGTGDVRAYRRFVASPYTADISEQGLEPDLYADLPETVDSAGLVMVEGDVEDILYENGTVIASWDKNEDTIYVGVLADMNQTESYLRDLFSGAATEANRFSDRIFVNRPQRDPAEVVAEVKVLADTLMPVIERVTGKANVDWNGTVELIDPNDPNHHGAAAVMNWDGTLGIDPQQLHLPREQVIHIITHELLHAVAGTTPAEFTQAPWLEEGVTEMVARFVLDEMLRALGVPPSGIESYSYQAEVSTLETLADELGIPRRTFAMNLLNVNNADRLKAMAKWARERSRNTIPLRTIARRAALHSRFGSAALAGETLLRWDAIQRVTGIDVMDFWEAAAGDPGYAMTTALRMLTEDPAFAASERGQLLLTLLGGGGATEAEAHQKALDIVAGRVTLAPAPVRAFVGGFIGAAAGMTVEAVLREVVERYQPRTPTKNRRGPGRGPGGGGDEEPVPLEVLDGLRDEVASPAPAGRRRHPARSRPRDRQSRRAVARRVAAPRTRR